MGHKIARRAIAPGEQVPKYGAQIGSAIAPGDHVHPYKPKSADTATASPDTSREAAADPEKEAQP